MRPVVKGRPEDKEKERHREDILKIIDLLEKNNKIRRKSKSDFLPFIVSLSRDAKIEDMEDIISTICIKVKDANLEEQAILTAFEESIKRLSLQDSLVNSSTTNDSNAVQVKQRKKSKKRSAKKANKKPNINENMEERIMISEDRSAKQKTQVE